MAWRAIARSAIGTIHQKQQMPCQDFGDYRILNDVIVGAVADGAGSAKYADIGAKLAVKTVLGYLAGIEEWLRKRKNFCLVTQEPLSNEQARRLFAKTVKKVVAALQKHAASNDYSVDDLACTLLVFVATPYWIAAMQIGDGLIVVRSNQKNYQLLFPPDKGEFINETTFVTSANALDKMQVDVLAGNQEFICAATDGLERVAVRMSDWTPFAPFFQPLQDYVLETSDLEQEDEYIQNFLNSDRLNARTDDDKTLLLCLLRR